MVVVVGRFVPPSSNPSLCRQGLEMQIHSLTSARLVDTELLALSIERVTFDRLFDL